MTEARKPGVVYTPPHLAGGFTRRAMDVWLRHNPHRLPNAIWDPAAGGGALLKPLRDMGVPNLFGSDIESDFLFQKPFLDDPELIIMNPPWIGRVSKDLGAEYAKRVKNRFDGYNSASDLSAAFLRRAAEFESASQISVLSTKTTWEGRTRRSGHDHLVKEWDVYVYPYSEGEKVRDTRRTTLQPCPARFRWPNDDAAAVYCEAHYVRGEGGVWYEILD